MIVEKWRKKPVVVEATKWTGDNFKDIKAWSADVGLIEGVLCVSTLEGQMVAAVGDYIIKGVNGEFYPCKPDIFHKTYDAAGRGGEIMSTKPILFSTPMVQAILDGRKTQTRRVIKPQPKMKLSYIAAGDSWGKWNYPGRNTHKYWGDEYIVPETITETEKGKLWTPPCRGDDVLWVRETWFQQDCTPDCAGQEDENECPFNRVGNACYGYKAQYTTGGDDDIKWRPSIHMPKEAARIFLRVTDVRVERVQEILCNDMLAEGVIPSGVKGGQWQQWQREYFAPLWDSISAKRGHSWASNPWVWVIEFEPADRPQGWPD